MVSWIFGLLLGWAAAANEPDIPAPAPTQVLSLPAELRARFHAEVMARTRTPEQRLDRLVAFVFEPQGLGMTYAHEGTYTVEQSYAMRKANCLGFTLLFLALAREAGLDARPQEIRQTLNWHQDNGTLYLSSHVNTLVRIGTQRFSLDVARDTLIARHSPEVISDQRLMAHYYNNLAMDQLAQDHNTAAQTLMQRSLELDPDVAALWNNVGVLRRRQGDDLAAELAYQQALRLDPRESGALFNLANLRRGLGDDTGAAEYQRRLARLQQKDPFHHFLLATDFDLAGDYPQAIAHYLVAIRWYDHEPRFYAALAQAYLHNGEVKRAAKALERAAALSEGATRAAYQAQRDNLH